VTRRLATATRLVAYYLVAALGYALGLAVALVYTVALWFVGAVIAGFRRGRYGPVA
jgi:uncharacterized membrane protein